LKLKITFLIDNTVYSRGLKAEHGLSVLIESSEEKILFDCGQSGLLLENAKNLNIDMRDISKIVLSHGHYDHTGGLLSILKYCSRKINVYAHPDVFEKRYITKNKLINANTDSKRYIGIPESRETYEKYGAIFNLNSSMVYLGENMMLSGFIPRQNDFEKVENEFMKETNNGETNNSFIHDEVEDDNAIIINDKDGLIIILGCAHSGVINIINRVIELKKNKRIKALIGGFHLNSRTEKYVDRIISELKKYNIGLIIPVHCTGVDTMGKIKEEFIGKCAFGSVGISLEIKH
jgi:7,8-dihydropterin-6-yl-methyl-4-(beta-D-ribofuranosyl)aminobenzene 5'-phosphate synthase